MLRRQRSDSGSAHTDAAAAQYMLATAATQPSCRAWTAGGKSSGAGTRGGKSPCVRSTKFKERRPARHGNAPNWPGEAPPSQDSVEQKPPEHVRTRDAVTTGRKKRQMPSGGPASATCGRQTGEGKPMMWEFGPWVGLLGDASSAHLK